MSETKKGVNPWIFTVILGVVAILFSVYALQSQSELSDTKKQLDVYKVAAEEAKQAAKDAVERQQSCEKMMQQTLDEFVKSREKKN